MDLSLDTVRVWLAEHGVAVFALAAFLDAFGPTGLISPASLMFIAAGALAAEGAAPLWGSLAAMWGAALVGNLLTFALGRLTHGWVPRRLRRYLPRVRRMLEREGPLLLLVYHYVNMLRAAVPVLCGGLHYPFGRYLLFSTPGLIVWISGLFFTGYLGFYSLAGQAPLWTRAGSALAVLGLLALGWYIWRGLKRAGADEDGTPPA